MQASQLLPWLRRIAGGSCPKRSAAGLLIPACFGGHPCGSLRNLESQRAVEGADDLETDSLVSASLRGESRGLSPTWTRAQSTFATYHFESSKARIQDPSFADWHSLDSEPTRGLGL